MPDDGTPVALPAGVTLRLVRRGDGPALAAAYDRDREHLAPWEPVRPEVFYDPAHQEAGVAAQLLDHYAGRCVPFVLERAGDVVGRLTLSDIVRGAFCNAHLGYWLASAATGHGVMTAAVEAAADHAHRDLGLHRLQAATVPHNAASQAVLARTGFTRIGYAPKYLRIAGRWQDHVLYQRLLP